MIICIHSLNKSFIGFFQSIENSNVELKAVTEHYMLSVYAGKTCLLHEYNAYIDEINKYQVLAVLYNKLFTAPSVQYFAFFKVPVSLKTTKLVQIKRRLIEQ